MMLPTWTGSDVLTEKSAPSIASLPCMRTIGCGARNGFTRAAHSLHRLTQQRPGAESPTAVPTQRWCSDCGKVRVNVTGKSARTVRLHPPRALGLTGTEAASSRRNGYGHPAELLSKGM
jgi:hypothetical protein